MKLTPSNGFPISALCIDDPRGADPFDITTFGYNGLDLIAGGVVAPQTGQISLIPNTAGTIEVRDNGFLLKADPKLLRWLKVAQKGGTVLFCPPTRPENELVFNCSTDEPH